MILIILVLLFLLWISFGSFWSVLVWRFMYGKSSFFSRLKSIVFSRSKCPKCNTVLTIQDLIPIISWIFLKWKCRYCWEKISAFYLFLEIISWFMFVFSFLFVFYWLWIEYSNIDFWILYLIITIVNWIFFLFVVWDFLFYYLVEPLWVFLFFLIIFYSFYNGLVYKSFISGLYLLILFLIIYFFGKFYVKIRFKKDGEWFWFWDVMVAFLMWLSIPIFFPNISFIDIFNYGILLLLFSSFLWLGLWLFYILYDNKKSLSKTIPFLPALVLAWYILQLIYMFKIDFF